MSIRQTKDGILRFPMPTKADDIMRKDPEALNELLNLVATGLNTNRYITSSVISIASNWQKIRRCNHA